MSIKRRIEDLERLLRPPEETSDAHGRQLAREFLWRALDAMAHVKRSSIDPEQWRYSVEKLRLYPRTAKLSNTWAQANWINASQFSAFLDQRVRRLRRLVSQEIVRSTTHLLAG